MAVDDILIGVGLDTGQIPGQVDALLTVIDQLSQQVQAAINDFQRFESEAAAVGTTTEALIGITGDTAAAYRDLAQSVDLADKAWRAFRITALSGVVRELDEVTRSVLNAGNAWADLQAGVADSGDFASLLRVGTAAGSGSLTALFNPGKRAIRPTDETLQQRARLDFSIENRRDRAIAADVNEKIDRLSDRRAGVRERFADREQDIEDRERRRVQFRGINASQREQFAEIDRQALEQTLAIRRENRGSVPLEEIQRREEIARRQFDIRQESTGQKQEVRDKAEDLKAQITMADNSQKSLSKLEAMLTKLGDIEAALKEDLTSNQLEILEDID